MNHFLYHALMAIRAIPAPEPVTWETVFGSSASALSGVSVTEDSALNYSPVWCGVSTLSRDIAKLPLVLYRNLPNGGKEPMRENKLFRILHDDFNPEMTSFKARETMTALAILYRNAYAEIVRDSLGRPVGLYPILPTRVTPMRTERDGRLFYRVRNPNGGTVDVQPANMIDLSGLSLDGIIGQGMVAHARDSIGLGVATEKFGAAFFGNGSTFGGIVEAPVALGTPQGEIVKNNIRSQIEAVHAGVERAHKILVLGAGSKFVARGTAPNEAQYIETRKFQINEVARWLCMPPHKLGDLENAHFTNIEEQEIQYYVGCVSGWLKMWEQELRRKLISPLEYAQQTIEFNLEGVLRGDSTKRADFYSKMFNIGAFSPNDILRLENKNPIGPAGDVHMVALNMIPIERYGEYIDATLAAKKAPKQLPAPKNTDESARHLEELKGEIREALTKAETHATRAVQAEAMAVQEKEHAEAYRAKAEQETAAATLAAAEARTKQAELTTALAERDAALAQQTEEARQRAEAEQRATEAEAARLKAEQDAQAHAARVSEAVTEAAAAVAKAELEAHRADAFEQEKATALADAQAARQVLAERESALEQAQQAVTLATADAAAVRQKADGLESSLQARKDTELDRLTRVVAAHRALIADVVLRLIRPEADRARRRHGTPDNLRKWADAFYESNFDFYVENFYPAILTHLAWKRSDDDPMELAKAMAREHCDESQRQIRNVIDSSTPEEFHVAVERMLQRWEQERPGKVADKVLHDELAYIRSYQ